MLIRDYRAGDFPAVSLIWELTGMSTPGRADTEQSILDTLRLGGRFRIMEDEDGRVIGTSWLSIDGRRTYLHHFGIHPDFQGRGLGDTLADDSLACAREIGLQIKLEVHHDNTVAKSLYRKHGFAYLGDYDVYIIRDIHKTGR